MNSTLKSLLFWMVLVVVGVLIWNFSHTFQKTPGDIPFSTVLENVEQGKVVKVQIVGNRIKGTTTGTTGNGSEQFRTYAPAMYEGLLKELRDKQIVIEAEEPTASPWATLLYSWAPILLMIGFWIFIMRQRPERLKDVEEIDVVEGQLAHSEYVDEDSRREVIAQAHDIDQSAHQRAKGAERATQADK